MFRQLALATLVGSGLLAQGLSTASLSGQLTDPANALVPRATVTLKSPTTGWERATTSSPDGQYSFSAIPVGVYSLTVAASGFSTFSQTGLRLNINTASTLNIKLTVGSVSDSVTVQADALMVNTTSGTLSQTVQQRYIQELPLNGRNAANLVRMVPGVVTGASTTTAGYANSADTIAISANGSRGNEVNYRLDGATHMDNVTNLNAAYPNPDAVQEFTVQTSNFSAQYGNFSGAVVNVATRSGSNEFHGSLFHFTRNGSLNARNYFAAQADNLKRNQFGATLGGPVLRNKLFFLGSFQNTIIRNESFSNQATVPNPAFRAGNFASLLPGTLIRDPQNANTPFPGNLIPSSRLRPIATNLLAKVPTATTTNGIIRYARPDRSDTLQYLGKLDYNLGNHHLSGSGFFNRFEDPGWDGANTLLTVRIGQDQRTNNWKLQDSWTLRPNLINSIIVSGLMLDSFNLRRSTAWLSQFGPIQFNEPQESDRQLELGVTGFGGWGSVTNSPPGQWIRRNVEINNVTTWIQGRHTLNFGAEYSPWTGFDSSTKFQQSGNFTFSGQLTGNGISDLLLGRVATFVQSAGKFKQTRGAQISLFLDDTWRLSRQLTLNAGLRWDPYYAWHDQLDQVSGYRPGARSQRFLNAPPGAIFAGDPGFPKAGQQHDADNFSPRFGFAWQPLPGNSATVVRGGYGIFYVRPFPRLYNNFVESAPFSPTLTLNGVDMQDPYGSAGVRNPFPPFAPVNLNDKNMPFSFPMPFAWFKEDWRVGYSQAWNLTVERQLGADYLLRAAYVANKGTNLQTFRERNWALYSPAATVANTNARRPLGQFFSSMRELVDYGNSQYHSLQLTLDKRFSRNFSVLAFYTWSKSIDDESANNQFSLSNPHPTDGRFNRGLSDFDIPHNFRLSGVFDLPKLQKANPLLRQLLGGWSLLNILDIRSGLPFGLSSGRDNSFSGIGLDRADLRGNPVLPAGRSRNDYLNSFFDRSQVTFNAVGTYGNSPRNFLRSPGAVNLDLTVQKTFPIRERIQLNLRGEFFNALNKANFAAPGNNVSAAANFGVITSAADPRILQVGARLTF